MIKECIEKVDGNVIERINGVPYVKLFRNKRKGTPCKRYLLLIPLDKYYSKH